MAGALQTAAELVIDAEIDVRIKITEDTSPQSIADDMLLLADNCNAIAVVSVVHPIVMQTVTALEERGIPIVALISQLSATRVRYIGLDNWEGRQNGRLALRTCLQGGGNLGMLVGKPRFERHEVSESGSRKHQCSLYQAQPIRYDITYQLGSIMELFMSSLEIDNSEPSELWWWPGYRHLVSGVLLIGVINNLLTLAQVPSFYVQASTGAVIIVAAILTTVSSGVRTRT
ncbi:hypothetical protein [Pararhizobium sp. LjRoot235]|uniref:hypothetical protein n=1 Tax=Pararhizobium sp. LjRoot235 TaxID=3342291 RepID=UPI003F4F5078